MSDNFEKLNLLEEVQGKGDDISFFLRTNRKLWQEFGFSVMEGILYLHITATSELAAYKLLWHIAYQLSADSASIIGLEIKLQWRL